MKKILSLILAVVMIALVVPTSIVTAEDVKVETKTIDATGYGEGSVATVTKKYFAVSYTMTASTHAGVPADNGCCGLNFDGENDCIYIPYDGGNTETQKTIGIWGGTNLVFGNWWNASPKVFKNAEGIGTAAVAITPDTEVTILVLGVKGDDGKTTITAYVNGKQVNVWGKTMEVTGDFAGKIGWATKLAGQKATVRFMESDDPILVIAPVGAVNVACDAENVSVTLNVLNNPGVTNLVVSPVVEGSLKFKGLALDEDEDLITDVFKDAVVGTNVVFDAGNKDSKKTGVLATFNFDFTSGPDADISNIDFIVRSAANYDTKYVATFTLPISVTRSHNSSDDWKSNADTHWHECYCGAKSDEADHVYDNACDTDCNVCGKTRTTEHTWVEKATEDYLKTAASCSTKAVYYKSCSACGAKSEATFEYGEPTGEHNYATLKHDADKHWYECGCGAKSDEAAHVYDNACDTDCNVCGKTRTTEHTWVEKATEDYLKTAASCSTKAVYYKSCSACGAKGEATFEYGEPTGEHNYANLKHDADKHWYECGCGAKGEKADHVYDNACDTDCNVCGEVRAVEHDYSTEWKHDANKHWHECGCGAKSGEADHDYGEGVVTTEPTTDAVGVKTFTCVCGATKTESIEKLPEEAPETGSTTALAVAVAFLTVSTGAAVVITRKKRSI